MPETPEQKARRQIDAQLAASGWVVQDKKAIDFNAAAVVAYLIIRWLRSCLDAPQLALATPKRELGFAATMKTASPP
jgi:hypothetical protein